MGPSRLVNLHHILLRVRRSYIFNPQYADRLSVPATLQGFLPIYINVIARLEGGKSSQHSMCLIAHSTPESKKKKKKQPTCCFNRR